MTTKELLTTSFDRWFSDEHFTTLKSSYNDLINRGVFDIEENDYKVGRESLTEHLSEEQQTQLAHLEKAYADSVPYAAKYGFLSGLFVGFHQYFIPSDDREYNMNSVLMSELFELPGMKRHYAYAKQNQTCLEILGQFECTLLQELYYHVTSIECAWGQRLHYAATHEFYLGYRAALSVIDWIVPFGSTKLLKEKLLLEYDLGMIEDVDSLERKIASLAMKQTGAHPSDKE